MNISVLKESQIDKIRQLTENVIENIGFRVEHENLLKIAAKAGAVVDEGMQTVKIPAKLLRELLSTVPESYVVKGIDKINYHIGGSNQYTFAIVTDPWIIDYKTKEPRRPCLEDVRINTILSQKNEHVAMISRMDYPVTDHKGAVSSLKALEMHLLNHSKHCSVYPASAESLNQWLEIGQILGHHITDAVKNSSPLDGSIRFVSEKATFPLRAIIEKEKKWRKN